MAKSTYVSKAHYERMVKIEKRKSVFNSLPDVIILKEAKKKDPKMAESIDVILNCIWRSLKD